MRSLARLNEVSQHLPSVTRTRNPTANLLAKMASSGTDQSTNALGPVYFWREYEHPWGFLSQWYDSPFEVDGVTYASTEMWMMVQKAKLFGDEVSPARKSIDVHERVRQWLICERNVGDGAEDDADDGSGRASGIGEEGEGF